MSDWPSTKARRVFAALLDRLADEAPIGFTPNLGA